MSIKEDMQELSDILREIKIQGEVLKNLRKQKLEIEGRIINFLQEKDLPGFKYKNMAIVTKERNVTERKKQKEKQQDILDAIYEIRNNSDLTPEQALEEIIHAGRGKQKTKTVIKIEKIK